LYTALEQSKEIPVRQQETVTQKNAKTPAVIGRVQVLISDESRAIVAKISINCWYKRTNNVSNCQGGPSIQIEYIIDAIDTLCQDKPSCLMLLRSFEKRSVGMNQVLF